MDDHDGVAELSAMGYSSYLGCKLPDKNILSTKGLNPGKLGKTGFYF
jgi:hypothetical protein